MVWFLHKKNFVYFLVTLNILFQPENVMLHNSKSRIVKLIDFGLSRKILPGTEVTHSILSRNMSHPIYLSRN